MDRRPDAAHRAARWPARRQPDRRRPGESEDEPSGAAGRPRDSDRADPSQANPGTGSLSLGAGPAAAVARPRPSPWQRLAGTDLTRLEDSAAAGEVTSTVPACQLLTGTGRLSLPVTRIEEAPSPCRRRGPRHWRQA